MTVTGDFESLVASNAGSWGPVLEITLSVAAAPPEEPGPWFSTTTLRLSSGIAYARGYAYNPAVVEWGDISRGFDPFTSNLDPLEVTIVAEDTDDLIRGMLESGGNQRGSVARIYYVLPGNAADYQTVFVGLLERWGYKSGHVVELTLRTDDALLRKYLPTWAVTKSEWPNAPSASVGLLIPVIDGTQNSSGLSGTGMLTAIPVNYTAGTIGWYAACVAEAKQIIDVYQNGTLKTAGVGNDYQINYSYTKAGRVYTVIAFNAGKIPAATDVITFDAKGYETTGNTGNGTTAPTGPQIVNPVEQMRHLLINFAEQDYKMGAWAAYESSARLDAESWSESALWAEQHLLEGTGFLGGSTEAVQVWDAFNEWLETWPMFRAYWTADGKLGLRVIGLEFPGYRSSTDPPVLSSAHDLGGAEYTQDTSNLTDSLSASYLYDEVQQKYLGTLAAIDPDAGSGISSAMNLKWSVRRAV